MISGPRGGGVRPAVALVTAVLGLGATFAGPVTAQESPASEGVVLGVVVRLDVTPRGVTVVAEYRLDAPPGLREIPVTAPIGDVGYEYDVDAELDGDRVDVGMGRESRDGAPRTLRVELPDEAGLEGGETLLALRYRIALRDIEGTSIEARLPLVRIPWGLRAPSPGAFEGRLRLPAGIELDRASPGRWTREEGFTNRLRYRTTFDAPPETIEVRASPVSFGEPTGGDVSWAWLVGAILVLGLGAWLLGRFMLGGARVRG